MVKTVDTERAACSRKWMALALSGRVHIACQNFNIIRKSEKVPYFDTLVCSFISGFTVRTVLCQ